MTQFETIIPLHTARLKFGEGATEELGYELKNMGARRVMLVVDPELWQFGLVDQVKAVVADAGIALHVFDQVHVCPFSTSDAADDLLVVDLGGRRQLKKKKTTSIIPPTTS